MTTMPQKFKNVHTQKTRSGRSVYYYRPERGRRLRLPDDYGTKNFLDAVRIAALIGDAVPRTKKPSEADNRKREIGRRLAQTIKGARQRAQDRGLDFDISLDWALKQAERQGQRCVLTGIPFLAPIETKSFRHPFAPSLDRIEPSKGYTTGNVRIVVLAVNVMLLDWGHDLFERVVSGYRFTQRTKTKPLFPHLVGGEGGSEKNIVKSI
jgi:hypothetical protein